MEILAEWGTNICPKETIVAAKRKQEYAADEEALRLAMAAGFDPRGAIGFFAFLKSCAPPDSGEIKAEEKVHPSCDQRIQALKEQMAQAGRPFTPEDQLEVDRRAQVTRQRYLDSL